MKGDVPGTRRSLGNLLHNMSAPPKTVIYSPAGDGLKHTRRIVFRLPDDWEGTSPGSPVKLPEKPGLDEAAAEHELRDRLNAAGAALPLPATALVSDRVETEDELCDDLLAVMAVLSKSSDHVYLRDKEPNLSSIIPGRRVVLVFPAERRPG